MSNFKELNAKKYKSWILTMQIVAVSLITFLAFASNAHAITDWDHDPLNGSGMAVTEGEFPFFVKMGGCGGTMIAPGWILTAKHCIKGNHIKSTTRLLADYVDRENHNDLGSYSDRVGQFLFKHQDYRGYTTQEGGEGDVALIQLDDSIAKQGLPLINILNNFSSFNTSRSFTAIGAGKSTKHKELSNWHNYGPIARANLAKAGVSVPDTIPQNALRKAENMYVYSSRHMLYVQRGNPRPYDAGTCSRDSGGPILMYDTAIPYQVGVISNNSMCNNSRSTPSGAASVDNAVISWIVDTIQAKSTQSAYSFPIPSVTIDKIQAVEFDYGNDKDVAYHDKDKANRWPNSLRPDEAVDESIADGERYVRTSPKEWIEYTVQIPESAVGDSLQVEAVVATRCSTSTELGFEILDTEAGTVGQKAIVEVKEDTGHWKVFETKTSDDTITFSRSGTATVRMFRQGNCDLNVKAFQFVATN